MSSSKRPKKTETEKEKKEKKEDSEHTALEARLVSETMSTLETTKVKEIYSQLKKKSTQLNSLLEQLSRIVAV